MLAFWTLGVALARRGARVVRSAGINCENTRAPRAGYEEPIVIAARRADCAYPINNWECDRRSGREVSELQVDRGRAGTGCAVSDTKPADDSAFPNSRPTSSSGCKRLTTGSSGAVKDTTCVGVNTLIIIIRGTLPVVAKLPKLVALLLAFLAPDC